MQTLKEALREWHDWDGAAYELAVAIGLMEPGTWLENKGAFWSRDPVGTALQGFLEQLATLGALEVDNVEWKIRWNPDFKGTAR